MKKSSFLTFCFALIPGAGQMYLGLMKKGVSIMALFFGTIATIGFLHFDLLTLLLPVIWFYSFFDTFNMRALSEEQMRYADKFILGADGILEKDWSSIFSKRHGLFGGILILIGAYLLYDNFIASFIENYISNIDWLDNTVNHFPTLVIAVAIIALGVHLIKGNNEKISAQKLLTQKDDLKEFGGEKND